MRDGDRQSQQWKSIGEATKVMGSLTLALPLAAADGPLPIGDIAAVVITVVALCIAHDYSIPETAEISAAVTEADFVNYLRSLDVISGRGTGPNTQ